MYENIQGNCFSPSSDEKLTNICFVSIQIVCHFNDSFYRFHVVSSQAQSEPFECGDSMNSRHRRSRIKVSFSFFKLLLLMLSNISYWVSSRHLLETFLFSSLINAFLYLLLERFYMSILLFLHTPLFWHLMKLENAIDIKCTSETLLDRCFDSLRSLQASTNCWFHGKSHGIVHSNCSCQWHLGWTSINFETSQTQLTRRNFSQFLPAR